MIEKEHIPIIDLLKNEEGSILLVSHENPDADTIGSALALYIFLKKFNKRVFLGMKDEVPKFANFLPYVDHYKKLPLNEEFNVAIIVDAAGFKRCGEDVKAKLKVRIDHHVGGDFYSAYDFIDYKAPSNTAVVYNLLKLWDSSKLDKDIALCIYTGLASDTGFFKNSNTTKEVFELASELCSYGVNPNYVWQMFGERETVDKMHLISLVLKDIKFYDEGLCGIVITRDMMEKTNTKPEDTEGLVSYPRSLEGVLVAFALIEMLDKEGKPYWRCSLRSKGNKVNVARIAQKLGGGGHMYASGFRSKDSLDKTIQNLIEVYKEELINQGINLLAYV